MFGKRKTFAVNNTGTKIRAMLGHMDKEEFINIDLVNTVDLAERDFMQNMGGPEEVVTDEESFSAKEILSENGTGKTKESKGGASLLFETFKNVSERKLDLGLNIPSRFVKEVFIDRDFTSAKPKQKDKLVRQEINTRLERPVSSEHYDYIETAENKIIGFTYEGRPPFLNIYDKANELLNIKPKIKLLLPDEIALVNLIQYNYQPEPDEIIAIVHLDPEYSQLIITKGGDLLHVSHAINIPLKSPDLLNKISGRLLYEKDLNNIEDFSRIIVTGMGKQKEAEEFLTKKLSFDSPVEYLSFNEERFKINAEIENDIPELAIPAGILVTCLSEQKLHKNTIDLIPEYIKDRQTFFKLSWYNVSILALLFFTPLFLGYRYNNIKNQYMAAKEKYDDVEQQIEDIKYIQEERNQLLQEIEQTSLELEKVREMSKGNYQLSKSLNKIKQVMDEMGGFWLENLNFDREKISLSGYTIYRNRPPRFVANFPDAKLEKITRSEIRGNPVYRFQIVINQVFEDQEVYNPQVD
ncbi:MAG: PilN domain-containing protein [Candidatus Marinimicrobia bacterium]|nr:PilN domain-containing protein [Candidatus Neomarinimicrobiota bacterium]